MAMATMIERQAASVQKELEKLNARLVREQKALEKKTAAAVKLGANCTREEWFAGKRDEYTPEQEGEKRHISETEGSIANAEKRLAKLTGKVEAQQEATAKEAAEVARISNIETKWIEMTPEEKEERAAKRKAEYEKWLAGFKAECLKDGIVIEEVIGRYFKGLTANGKRFFLDGNNGYTNRSRYCYTLTINGNTVFTSGEFVTAYRYLMMK